MSHAYGSTQRAILDLIAANPHGAWTTLALATAIYGDASRPCQNAVLRALRAMKLPGTWAFEHGWRRRGYHIGWAPGVLCDPHDAISLARSHGVEPGNRDQADRLALYAKEAAFNRMTPLEQLDVKIAEYREHPDLTTFDGEPLSVYYERQREELLARLAKESEA
jgi:hypothetical protein